nr:MAG TPA: hypothetical protein [Caudoviricetes sp.]DAU20603.1 MAG TPA: hypothetical protein [Caudoviricetes sp.]DAX14539.1 MAG TPA: hypothetical protein [Bacteriophage sp.]
MKGSRLYKILLNRKIFYSQKMQMCYFTSDY